MELYGRKFINILKYMENIQLCKGLHIYISSVTKFPFASASGSENHICRSVLFRNDGDAKPVFFIRKLLPRPWDLSHGVERQKLMVLSREEMSVRVRKGGFMVNLLLHHNFRPNVLFETL